MGNFEAYPWSSGFQKKKGTICYSLLMILFVIL